MFYGPGNSTHVPPHGCCNVAANAFPTGPATTMDLSAVTPPLAIRVR